MQSSAKTPAAYLAELPPERRALLLKVRALIKKNLPKGYAEGMGWGTIVYSVPLKRYPKGYGENPNVPLPYVALASQKNYCAVYMMGTYGDKKADEKFRTAYKKAGKKLDMGKGCLRFKKFEDLLPDALAAAIASTPVDRHIANYEKARQGSGKRRMNKKK